VLHLPSESPSVKRLANLMNDYDLFKPSSPEKKVLSYSMPSTGGASSGYSGSSSYLFLAIISISSIFRIEVIL
jgi:hypothetical protein